MARRTERETTIDIRPAIEHLGLGEVIRQVGKDAVAEYLDVDWLIERMGKKKIIKRIGIDDFLSNLSADELRELKRRLK